MYSVCVQIWYLLSDSVLLIVLVLLYIQHSDLKLGPQSKLKKKITGLQLELPFRWLILRIMMFGELWQYTLLEHTCNYVFVRVQLWIKVETIVGIWKTIFRSVIQFQINAISKVSLCKATIETGMKNLNLIFTVSQLNGIRYIIV